MKTIQFPNLEELYRDISKQRLNIIAIDGEDGVGKTSKVIPLLKAVIKCEVIHLDDYQIKKRDKYLLNLKEFKEEIKRQPKDIILIIEGITILDVLKQTNIKPDTHIYVEGESCRLVWNNDYGLYMDKSLQDIYNYAEKQMGLITPGSKLTPFRKQVIEYHFNYRPFNNADYKIIMSRFD